MSRFRAAGMVVALVLLGAAGSLAVAAALGMHASELAHLAALLGPAVVVTIAAAMLAGNVLRRTSLRHRFVAVAAVGTLVALANLLGLSRSMFVSQHDASAIAIVLTYAGAAGLAAAAAAARSSASAVDRVTRSVEALRRGDLRARVGSLRAGPELDRLAATLDDMAQRLEVLRAREARVEATRRDLITAVSHDLRTPLSSLQAMLEAIDDGLVADPSSIRRYAVEMHRAVGQLTSMVDDLFELVQVDAGAIENETERAHVQDVVASAVAAVAVHASGKGVLISADVDGLQDATCSPRLLRVLQNLLVNAVRHTPADGTVQIAGVLAASRLTLTVRDSGEGIPPEALPFVFDPFYREDLARSGGGAGLGLALAQRIVQALGGSIKVASRPRQCTMFEVILPTDVATPQPRRPASPAPAAS